jgi:hypothetical protein
MQSPKEYTPGEQSTMVNRRLLIGDSARFLQGKKIALWKKKKEPFGVQVTVFGGRAHLEYVQHLSTSGKVIYKSSLLAHQKCSDGATSNRTRTS